uniref:Alpha/beta hydrolase domain-containing protein 13 n=1 Tax=Schistocephalus solidus TaxID=70667 RepID=A0A0V0J2X4_SCHSO
MRFRRAPRLMGSLFRYFKERVCGVHLYSPLSPKRSSCFCSFLAGTNPTDIRSHKLAFSRHVLTGHLPNLLCPFVLALRLFFPEGFFGYVLTFSLLLLLLASVIHLLENIAVFAPTEPENARFLIECPKSNDFLCWKVVKLRPQTIENDLELKCIFILHPDVRRRETAPTLLFLHGNAGNIGHRVPLCRALQEVCGANFFLLEYRGFGYNGGQPSELGLYADAIAALDYLTNCSEINPRNIFVYGRSLGGAVAIELATRADTCGKLRGVIIENTFSSIAEMGQAIGSTIAGSPAKLLPTFAIANKFESLEKLNKRLPQLQDKERCRFLFLSGGKDELIPPEMMYRLAKSCFEHLHMDAQDAKDLPNDKPPWVYDPVDFSSKGSEGLVLFPDGEHGTTWLCDHYPQVVNRFLLVHNEKLETDLIVRDL